MIRTGGGTFDPEADRFCYFIAGGSSAEHAHRRYHLSALNDCMTEGGLREDVIEPIERGAKLLLDSGIFNLTNNHMRKHGGTMDQALALAPEQIDGFDKLFDRYVEVMGRYEDRLWGYIELDQGGAVGKRRTRAKLHDLGLRPIPVYHPLNDGWDYFDELAETHDRICFGNIVQASPSMRVRLLHTMWERRRRYPHLWIHVLGQTINEYGPAIPSDSCDSSAWLAGMLGWANANVATTYLSVNRMGKLPKGLIYARGVDADDPRGDDMASHVYANAFDTYTDLWRQIMTDRAAIGFDAWPTPMAFEEPLCPQTTSA